MDFYENIRRICAARNTTVSEALKHIGKTTALTGKWKNGSVPSAQIIADLSDYLNVSMDVAYRGAEFVEKQISDEDQMWLDIIHQIPEEKHAMLQDFLRTHVVRKYEEKGKNA